MSNSLTSHEDLTPYIQQLERLNSLASNEMERRRSFAADPETIIRELLTELMSSRKYLKQVTSIAHKFLEAYNTGIEESHRLTEKNNMLQENIGDLNSQIQKYEKEIEIKESRYESIALEATDMERIMKMLNTECSQLKKEKELLKKEISLKEQAVVFRDNTIQQRQKMHIEVEKDKEVDKTLQIKCDSLAIENKRKQAEIDDLNSNMIEIENALKIEKNNSEKLKLLMQQIRNENSIKKSELEELKQKHSNTKEKLNQCKEELLQQKSYNESLAKECEKQRNSIVLNSARASMEIPEEVSNLVGNASLNFKSERLGDLIQELENSESFPEDDSFFIVSDNSTKISSPKFMLFQPKKICKCDDISIEPQKIKNNEAISILERKELYPEEEKMNSNLKAECEALALENQQKQSEIDNLHKKIIEIEDIMQLEKNNSEEIKIILQKLQNETLVKNTELEEINKKFRNTGEILNACNEELLKQTTINKNLLKEQSKKSNKILIVVPLDSILIQPKFKSLINETPIIMNKAETLDKNVQTNEIQIEESPFVIKKAEISDKNTQTLEIIDTQIKENIIKKIETLDQNIQALEIIEKNPIINVNPSSEIIPKQYNNKIDQCDKISTIPQKANLQL